VAASFVSLRLAAAGSTLCVRRWIVVRIVGGRFESGLSAIWESQFVSPGHLELRRCGRLGPDFE